MEERLLGNTGQHVTILGFGALEIGRDWGIGDLNDKARPSESQATATLQHAIDLGMNFIDTASAYHASEERIGRALASERTKYFLASKCGEHNALPHTYYDFGYDAVRRSIDTSLQRLNTSVIDLMQIHFGPRPHGVLEEGSTVRAMRDAREQGKVRFLGASCEADTVPDIIALKDFDVVQLTYNLLDRKSEYAIKNAADHGLGVTIRFPLAMGWLTPRAQVLLAGNPQKGAELHQYLPLVDGDFKKLIPLALHFIANLQEVSCILIGSKNTTHLDEAVNAIEMPFPEGLVDQAIHRGF